MNKEAVKKPDWHLKELDKTLLAAAYFGFLPIEAPKITDKDIQMTRDCEDEACDPKGRIHYDAAEKAALLRTYLEKDFASLSHPLALAYKKPSKGSVDYSLHLVGFAGGLSEAILIRSALSVLSEEGYKNLVVDINCIGDKESINAYERELNNYAKKAGSNLSADIKKHLKKDVFNLMKLDHPEALALREAAPSSIAFLSAASRSYFKEVLEFIEALGVEFRLNPELVGNKHYCSHTIFAVRNAEVGNESTLAVGYRYSRLSKRLGFKKEIPMSGITIFSEPKKEKKVYKDLPKPKFYLVQLGREAKMKTLALIELLRSHKIPVYHFLGKDKITAQLSNAESLRVPYLLIVGQKEALDNTVTIRNMTTRAQATIDIKDLPAYLKNISLLAFTVFDVARVVTVIYI